jgi:uncharacterized membrane protein (UPF0136 family)
MGWLNVVLLVYGLLDIGMGVLGYVNKGSVVSLIAGGVCGLIVIVSILTHKGHPRNSRIAALIVTILMMIQFGPKTFIQNQLYPSGIMFVASLAVAVCLLMGHVMGMKARKSQAAESQK